MLLISILEPRAEVVSLYFCSSFSEVFFIPSPFAFGFVRLFTLPQKVFEGSTDKSFRKSRALNTTL